MLASNLLRMVLVATMAALVFTQSLALWMIYGFALVFGLIDAFFWPASIAIVPQLLPPSMLQGANALVQGTAQASLLLGPVLAGFAIGALGGQTGAAAGDATPGLRGIGVVLAFDALTFLASAVTLWLLRVPRTSSAADTGDDERSRILCSCTAGRAGDCVAGCPFAQLCLISAAINFLVNGPIDVGIPVLADARLAGGAAAFGIMMSALGGGSLTGMLLAGSLPRPAPRRGPLLLTIISLLGVGLIILAFTTRTWMGAAAAFVMGISSGYVNISSTSPGCKPTCPNTSWAAS
ncbi:MAG: MFS transporter [Caldilineaceae bacterium]